MHLLEADLLPPWAMFVYPEMKHARGRPFLATPAVFGEGFLLVAPIEVEGGLRGLLLAEAKASGKPAKVCWQDVETWVQVPKFSGFHVALSGIDLDFVTPPPAEP